MTLTPSRRTLDVSTITELAQVRGFGSPGICTGVAVRRLARFAQPVLGPGAGPSGYGDCPGARALNPGCPAVAGAERGLRRGVRARQANRRLHPVSADRANSPATGAAGHGAV